jgi:endonuclease-3
MNKQKRIEIFTRLRNENPHPTTELNYGNPFQLLVAVTLSAQATDVGVNKATRALFRIIKTPQAMLRLGEPALKEHIKTIGLYNNKAKNLIAACRILLEQHGGKVPDQRRQRHSQYGVRPGHDCGRHPYFPGIKSNRYRAR